jgi:hypothetical protein
VCLGNEMETMMVRSDAFRPIIAEAGSDLST